MIPNARPRLSSAELNERIKQFNVDQKQYPLFIAAIRGYYKNSLGEPGTNDWGIYDDAAFIISPGFFAPYNFNTDPSKHRPGYGTGEHKGMGQVKTGLWYYTFGIHHGSKSSYPALIPAREMTVIRDGVEGPYQDDGWFGDNIHAGGETTTGSEGCQTVPPKQWDSFYGAMVGQAKRLFGDQWKTAVIPYILIEE
jgi:lysozyme